jgi:Lrp/AsnC family transcriptional regulator for asnA, asnC and gidA
MAHDALDDTDAAILEILQRDGRAPYSVIARELGLSESTVRQRCNRIFESGLVSVVATGDPLQWGIPVDAVHLVQVDPGRIETVADEVAEMAEVRYVGVTLGGGVLVVESLHPSADDLHDFLVQRLHALPGVKEVNSHQVVRIRKSVWDWRSWLRSLAERERAQPSQPTRPARGNPHKE